LTRKGLALRPAADGDDIVLRTLHHAGRAAEIGRLGWPAMMAERFLDDQLRLRDRHYQAHHPAADNLIVTMEHVPVGRLLLDRAKQPWRLIDIALAPEMQNRGSGRALLYWLQSWARRDHAEAIDLHVLRDNIRAEAFYRRLGFIDADDTVTATHRRLIWPVS
jgi:GNAT superfamily N-acetyltransferase